MSFCSRHCRSHQTCVNMVLVLLTMSACMQMIHKAGMRVYSEVDGAATLLGFSTINAGCCKVRRRVRAHTMGLGLL